MDHFFLHLHPKQQEFPISYASKMLLLGSCFVDNIGEKLKEHKFQTEINPFGIVFHPKALETVITRVVNQKKYTEADIFLHNEQWHCFEVHSKLSSPNKENLLEKLNSILEQTRTSIQNVSHIILTFGTAYGYYKNDKIVANCHKIPQKNFKKLLSTPSAIAKSINTITTMITTLNPNGVVISTVSPIRHVKDGIVENNLSKAHLISGLHTVISNTKKIYYYPAYELIIDCLREYRFYESDLIHPNAIAIDFIWEHFKKTWLYESETKELMEKVVEIRKGLAHRPFNPKSEAHQQFIKALSIKKDQLSKKYPNIVF